MGGTGTQAPSGQAAEIPNSLRTPNPKKCFTVVFIHEFVLLGTVRQVQRYPDCVVCAESGSLCEPIRNPAICGCDTCDDCVVAAMEDEREKDQLRAEFSLEQRGQGGVGASGCVVMQHIYQCGHKKGLPFFERRRDCSVCGDQPWPNLCMPDRDTEGEHISEVTGRCSRCRHTMAPPPPPPRSPRVQACPPKPKPLQHGPVIEAQGHRSSMKLL